MERPGATTAQSHHEPKKREEKGSGGYKEKENPNSPLAHASLPNMRRFQDASKNIQPGGADYDNENVVCPERLLAPVEGFGA